MGFSIGTLYMELLAQGGRLRQSIEQEATKAADKAGQKAGVALGTRMAQGFAKAGKTLQTTGTAMTRNVTLPIVAVGAAVVAVGTQFDTTLRQIVALTDVTADEISGIRERLLELAPALGKTPQELAEGFYFLASAGFTTTEALTVLESTAKASAVGLGTTADVSRVIGAAINAYGKENLTAAEATDQLIRAVKDGTAEAPAFAGALGDVLGSAAQVGATFSDTTAAIAAMTLKGINADEAATSLNQVFLSLIKTTPQAEEALKGVGLSSEGLREQLRDKGLLSVLQTLSERFEGNETAAADAFGNVRALRGILALTTGDAAATARVFEDVANGTTTLNDAFKETEGPGREMDRAMAEMQVVLLSLAEDVLPPFTELLREVVGIVHGGVEVFKSLPEPVRDGIVQILAITAALGPLLLITGKVASGIGMLINGVKLLAGLPGVATAAGAVGSTLGGLIGAALPLGLVAAGGIGIALAFKAIILDPGLQQQTRDIGQSVGEQIATGTLEQLQTSKAALEKGIADINALPLGGMLYGDQVRDLQTQLDAVNAAIASGGSKAATAFVDGYTSVLAQGGTPKVVAAVAKMTAAAKAAARKIPDSIASGILAGQKAVPDAMNVLRNLMKNALSRSAIIARDIGILTSKELARGLNDKRPAVREEAKRVQAMAEQELASLILKGGKVGHKAMDKLNTALHDKNAAVRAAARRVKNIVTSQLEATEKPAGAAGAAAGAAFVKRLKAAMSSGDFHINASVGFTLPNNAAGGPVQAGMPTWWNEQGPEIFVPAVDGRILSHEDSMAAVAGRGSTYNVTVNNPEPRAAEADIGRVLRRTAALGMA